MKNKHLGKLEVLALVVGSIIGWGSFTLPGKQFLSTSGVINTTIGLIIGGLFILLIQSAYHRMLELHKEDGGEFTYVLNNLGNFHGFLVGWSLSLCYLSMIPLNAGAYVLLVRVIFGESFSFGYIYSVAGYGVYISDIIIMSTVILVFCFLNIKGLKISSKVQNIMSTLLVLLVFFILVYMFFTSDLSVFNKNYISNYNFSLKEISLVVAIVPFLFVGFDVIPQVASNLKFSPSKATRLTIIGIFLGVFVYASLNIIAGLSFSGEEALKTDWAVADSIISKMGYIGFSLMLIALFAAITGGINGFMIASSKLISSIADKGMLNKKYSKVNHKGVSNNAILFVSMVSLIAPWFGREVIIYIVDMASVLAAIAYGYVCFLGIRNAVSNTKKVVSFFGTILSILFILLLLIPFSPARLSIQSFAMLVSWMIFGLITYYYKQKKIK